MADPLRCPECDSTDTKREHVEFIDEAVDVVRVCKNCPAQYVVCYGNPVKTVVNRV